MNNLFTFIEPSVTRITEPDLQRKVEMCYRVCYKSENRMSDTSRDFLTKILYHTTGNHHWSPLEHARITVRVPNFFAEALKSWERDRKLHYFEFQFPLERIGDTYPDKCDAEVTGNFRTFMEYLSELQWKWNFNELYIAEVLAMALNKKYPYIFSEDLAKSIHDKAEEHVKDGISALEAYWSRETLLNDMCIRECDNYRTYRIITTRDILQELARHRSLSFSVESTRYCNYDKKGLVFTLPRPYAWADEVKDNNLTSTEAQCYYKAITDASEIYIKLIQNGVQPQVARMVLPGALKAELIMTGTDEKWKAFLKLRNDEAAHPQIRLLAQAIARDMGLQKE